MGAFNLAGSYEFGIGTKTNYARAAEYLALTLGRYGMARETNLKELKSCLRFTHD